VCISILVRATLYLLQIISLGIRDSDPKLLISFFGIKFCSIQHPPGEDRFGYEDAGERWMPVHTVETILLSVISMLSSPNDESPANIEAAVS